MNTRPFTHTLRTAVLTLAVSFGMAGLADTTLQLGFSELNGANESNRTAFLAWTAEADKIYKVQSSTNVADPAAWQTIDAVGSSSNGPVRWMAPEAIGRERYFRLGLPQPEIFAVEPAIIAPGAEVDMYVIGQSFGSNDVLQINGEPQTNVIYQGSSLLKRPTFTPSVPGTYTFQLVVSGKLVSTFNVMCADASANPELVLQGPPDLPPAAPMQMRQHEMMKSIIQNIRARTMGGGGGGGSINEADEPVGISALAGGTPRDLSKDGLKIGLKLTKAGSYLIHVRASSSIAVNPSSGDVEGQAVDLVTRGRSLDFVWARTYHRVGLQVGTSGNWSHSYDVHLQPLGGDILIHDGTGREDLFRLQTNGTYTCPQFFREGTMTGGVFRLTFADTGYWEFNALTGLGGAEGKLAKIVDRNANTMLLHYDGLGRLAQVVDDLDRTNSVTYDTDGRIAAVTDFSGRSVTYHYYRGLPGEPGAAGDLASVTSPPVTGTPNTNDFPFGKTVAYTYSAGSLNDAENHLLLSAIDALGQITATFQYDMNSASSSYLRCVSAQCWTNKPVLFTYVPQVPSPTNQYAAMRCIINDAVGNVNECFYDARLRMIKLLEFSGRATSGVPVTVTLNRPTGKLRSTDPDYFETRCEWNSDSLPTSVTDASGVIHVYRYERDFQGEMCPARKRADLRVLRELACCGGADTDGDGSNDLTERAWYFTYDSHFGTCEDRKLLGWDPLESTCRHASLSIL